MHKAILTQSLTLSNCFVSQNEFEAEIEDIINNVQPQEKSQDATLPFKIIKPDPGECVFFFLYFIFFGSFLALYFVQVNYVDDRSDEMIENILLDEEHL